MNIPTPGSNNALAVNQAVRDSNGNDISSLLNMKETGSVDNGNNITNKHLTNNGPIFRLLEGKYVQVIPGNQTQNVYQFIKRPNAKECLECKECGASFTTQNELSDHQNNGIKYYCGPCKRFFACKDSVKTHLQTHIVGSSQQKSIKVTLPCQNEPKDNEDSQFQCKECGKSFVSESTLKRHLKTHSKLITCDKCSKQFTMFDFFIHNKSSECIKRKTVFKCKECKKKFPHLRALNIHINTHTKPFSCNECGKHFSQKNAMEHHQSTRKCSFDCKECEKSFSNKNEFGKHKRAHKNFECKDCGKLFAFKNELVVHGNIHTGVRPYICEVCEKTFSRPDTLFNHRKIHQPSKWNCEDCGKCFTIKRSLERHLSAHTGIKPFKCDLCGKGFTEKSSLQTHLIYHGDARPFECETCGKGFKTKHNLLWHNKTVQCSKD